MAHENKVLFRGMHSNEFVYGAYLEETSSIAVYTDGLYTFMSVDPETVGQLHNGLTRRAGQNVFVGDIVKCVLAEGFGEPEIREFVSQVTSTEYDFFYFRNVRLIGNKFDGKTYQFGDLNKGIIQTPDY